MKKIHRTRSVKEGKLVEHEMTKNSLEIKVQNLDITKNIVNTKYMIHNLNYIFFLVIYLLNDLKRPC